MTDEMVTRQVCYLLDGNYLGGIFHCKIRGAVPVEGNITSIPDTVADIPNIGGATTPDIW